MRDTCMHYNFWLALNIRGEGMGAGQSKDSHAVGANGPSELSTSEQSSCPVPESVRGKAVYNVYNQRIDGLPAPKTDVLDPSNNMPAEPNQQPAPGQKKLLSTERVVSNIPKGNTTSTWVYPSPQMFFNGAHLGLGLAAQRSVHAV